MYRCFKISNHCFTLKMLLGGGLHTRIKDNNALWKVIQDKRANSIL